ncbi:MAG: hypothetical protein NPIRA05_22750 [Nitrospirales bacterium]|nr:MAG: hypothetical protein NPIRA05_22750 [Nitrospirales bacterium]
MILKYENDVLDEEHSAGHFYHVCQGRVQEKELPIPSPDEPYECPDCGIDLEQEDFLLAQRRGWS